MVKRPHRRTISDQRVGRAVRRRHEPDAVKVPPLPVWCHPEFHQFLDGYTALVDKQINTFLVMDSYGSTDYTKTELAYWKSVKRSLRYLRHVGTRKHD